MSTSKFRTEIQTRESNLKIGLSDTIITIGSCFSDVIGTYLNDYRFQALVNPFGTVYNPVSIFNLLSSNEIRQDHLAQVNGNYFHHDFHSSFFSQDKSYLIKRVSTLKNDVVGQLKNTDWLIITVGTSFVYEFRDSGQVVSNCHKVPQKNFIKRMLSVKETIEAFENWYEQTQRLNPNVKVLLTVSPVRHLKDGIEENSVSKSKLRLVCDELVRQNEKVYYFPSYEIMMDDLRDYRFYKADMIHPNEQAEDYIWEKFQESYFDKETNKFVQDWTKIRNSLAHRPFNPESESHQKFLKKTLSELELFPEIIDVSKEREIIVNQLI